MKKTGAIITWSIFTILILSILLTLSFIKKEKVPPPSEGVTAVEPELPKDFVEKPETIEPEKREETNQELYGYALETRSLDSCNTIALDDSLKQNCLDQVSYSKALKNPTTNACQAIANEILKNDCTDRAFLEEALNKKDSKLCNSIQSEKMKASCLNVIKTQS